MLELLDTLRKTLGCTYLSDLRYTPFNQLARQEMQRLDLRMFSLTELSEVAQYLCETATVFTDYTEAEHFFQESVSSSPGFL